MSRTKLALWNMLSNIVYKIATVGFVVILPRIMIVSLGSEINGFISSITSMFVYINLLEAGVGGASTFSLYASIAYNNRDQTNGIMAATNRYYRKIGVYFSGCIFALAFIYPFIVDSDMSYLTVCIVVLLTATPYLFNYFVQGKYAILLSSDNRSYVLTNVNTIISILSNTVKIILLINGHSIIIVQLAFALVSSLQAIMIYLYIKKKYPWLNLSVKPDYHSIRHRASVMIHQVSGVLFANSGILLLTFFSDLKTISVYTVYMMIYSQVSAIPQLFPGGVQASLGQIYNEDFKRFRDLFSSFEIYFFQVVYASFATAYMLTLPFLRLYTANITDINYIDERLPILFAIAQVLMNLEIPYALLIRISGHFKETRGQAVLEAITNIVVSFVLVFNFGIYGVLIGVITSVLYRCIVTIRYCNKFILRRSFTINAVDGTISVLLCAGVIAIFNTHIKSIVTYGQLLVWAFTLFTVFISVLVLKTILTRRTDTQILWSFIRKFAGLKKA